MPCKDVTEVIRIELDGEECLRHYAFAKRTCGQGIGAESLLIDQLRGCRVDQLLAMTAQGFLDAHPIGDEIEEFLSLKHLFAVQSALEVYTGKEPGRRDDAFAAGGIEYGDGETIIEGRIVVDVITDKIKACGGCGSCGSDEKVEEARRTNAQRREKRTGTSIPESPLQKV